jgi:hypothetical protein
MRCHLPGCHELIRANETYVTEAAAFASPLPRISESPSFFRPPARRVPNLYSRLTAALTAGRTRKRLFRAGLIGVPPGRARRTVPPLRCRGIRRVAAPAKNIFSISTAGPSKTVSDSVFSFSTSFEYLHSTTGKLSRGNMANLSITDNQAPAKVNVNSVDDFSNVPPRQLKDETFWVNNKHKSATPGSLEDLVGHHLLLRCR